MENYEEEYRKFEQKVEAMRRRMALRDTPEIIADLTSENLFEELNTTVEELSVAQEEMRQQNEELVASRTATEEATHRYRELFDFAPDAYFVTSRDGVIREANFAAATLLNVPQDYLTGKPLAVFVDAEARRAFRSVLAQITERSEPAEWEARLQPRHRLYVDAQFRVSAARRTGGADELRWTARDITDRKRDAAQMTAQLDRIEALNEALKQERANLERRVRERGAELEAEVAERIKAEIRLATANKNLQRAMTEIHHRVKNNLQMASALIDLQAQDLQENPGAVEATFQRLTGQIRAMAALHDALTHQAKENGDVDYIPAGAILEPLIPLAQQTTNGVTVQARFDEARLPTPRAMALAIIANELISNAVKHGGRSLSVSLRAEREQAIMEVCDDGPGFPPDFRPDAIPGIGLELVNNMTRHDLNGQAHYENRAEGGACVRIVFPLRGGPILTPA